MPSLALHTELGLIVLALRTDAAPITAAHIQKLAAHKLL